MAIADVKTRCVKDPTAAAAKDKNTHRRNHRRLLRSVCNIFISTLLLSTSASSAPEPSSSDPRGHSNLGGRGMDCVNPGARISIFGSAAQKRSPSALHVARKQSRLIHRYEPNLPQDPRPGFEGQTRSAFESTRLLGLLLDRGDSSLGRFPFLTPGEGITEAESREAA